jgi:outer membrane protein assembly factor BamE
MQIKIILISALLALSLTGCTSFDFSRRVVQQGNLLSEATVGKLKQGMTKEEVAILLGTSLLSPTFDNQRWDYAYTWRRGSGSNKMRQVVIFFQNDRVVRIQHSL